MPSATEIFPLSGAMFAPAIESYYFGRWMVGEKISRKKILSLRNEEIRPAIRLAHRRSGTLNFRKRIIFDHMLVFVASGRICWDFRDQIIEAGPSYLLFMPPFEPHSSKTGEKAGCEHIAIHFDWRPSFPWDELSESGRSPYRVALPEGWGIPAVQKLSQYDRLPGIFERIVNLRRRPDGLSHLHADALLFDALMDLIKRNRIATSSGREQGQDRARIEAALLLMERSPAAPLNVARLAEAAGMSPSWFSHVFRASMGRTPMEHLAALRLEHARGLLCESSLSVKEVAVRCGFPDPYHFSKVFSRLEGMPPSEYRAKMLH